MDGLAIELHDHPAPGVRLFFDYVSGVIHEDSIVSATLKPGAAWSVTNRYAAKGLYIRTVPNPAFRILPTSTVSASSWWMPHNGWLACVPGDLISQGMVGFPPPDEKAKSPRTSDIDVPGLGMFRIRYKTSSYTHYRCRFWRWGACWADKVDAQGNVIPPNHLPATLERK